MGCRVCRITQIILKMSRESPSLAWKNADTLAESFGAFLDNLFDLLILSKIISNFFFFLVLFEGYIAP